MVSLKIIECFFYSFNVNVRLSIFEVLIKLAAHAFSLRASFFKINDAHLTFFLFLFNNQIIVSLNVVWECTQFFKGKMF